MFTRTAQPDRELFKPQPDWYPVYVVVSLLLSIFVAREFSPLILAGAVIACSARAWSDFLTANWLLRCDPDQERGRACFWFCLSRGTLKVVLAAVCLSIVAYNLTSWHSPIDWEVPVTLLFGITAHAAFAIVGCQIAARSRIRVWIDSGLNRSRREHIWPPRCRGANNDAGSIWLTAVAVVIVFTIGAEALISGVLGYEFPVGCALAAVIIGAILYARRATALTPEECWSKRRIATEPRISAIATESNCSRD